MFKKIFSTSRFFVLSASLHTLLLLGGLFYLNFSRTPLSIGEETMVVQSYTYHEKTPSLFKTISPPTLKTQLEKKIEKNALALERKKTPPKPENSVETSSMVASQKSGEKQNALLSLLHEAIQREQHYPESARALEREGRVTVKFNLYQTGEVSHVRVAQSSGTYSLDEAALKAVLKASPFKGVASYVTTTQEYSVDVIFEA